MGPDEEKLLRETFDLAKKNNKLLRKIRSHQVWGRVYRVLYWLLIIGLAFGIYYYIQPLISQVTSLFDGIVPGIENIKNIGENLSDVGNVNNLFDQIKQ